MKNLINRSVLCLLITLLLSNCQRAEPTSLYQSEFVTNAILTKQDIHNISRQACADLDNRSIILPLDDPLKLRLNRLTNTLTYTVNDIAIDYQIYLSPEVNAWAMANGCVRVNSGLMKAMTDNQIQAVLAHELAHIALEHKYKAFQASQQIKVSHNISSKYLLVDKLFSARQEIEADDYAFDFLTQRAIDPQGLIIMLETLQHTDHDQTTTDIIDMRLANIQQKMAL